MSTTRPKLSPSVARKIKVQLGQEAYEEYKRTGFNPLDNPSQDSTLMDGAPESTMSPSISPSSTSTSGYDDVEAGFEAILASGKVALPDADKESMETLKSSEVGDLFRATRTGARFRVQKKYTHGLRLRDNDGARDFTWKDLELLGPFEKIERLEDGPAARRLGDLRAEAEKLGIDCSNFTTVREIEAAMGVKLGEGRDDILDQIAPMLASDDVKKEMDYSFPKPWRTGSIHRKWWDSDQWAAEEKIDGVRIKLHFTKDGIRADSRRADTKTRRFSEKTQNFPHLKVVIPELLGTVIDTEAIIPVKTGVLPSGTRFYGSLPLSTATCNAGPDTAMAIQEKFGPMQFWTFDILRYKGKDVSGEQFSQRRRLLEKVVDQLLLDHPDFGAWLSCTQISYDNKVELYEKIIGGGGEGVILKKLDSKYQEGKRPRDWQKVKAFLEVDAFVTGWIPGENAFTGLVGALKMSVRINGVDHWIASVSQITLEERKAMSMEDGSLRPEYYGRVAVIRGQELTGKNHRFRHAIFVTWREDKAADDCDAYEIIDDLRAMEAVPYG